MNKLLLFRLTLILALTGYCISGYSQIITTVAGTGAVYSGEGVPATTAGISGPVSGCFDKFGNYYFVDRLANRVRKVTPLGTISTVAGNGTYGALGDGSAATAAQLASPSSVAADTSGNLYVADRNNNKIRRISAATGTITTFAGTGTAGFSGESGPATAADINAPVSIAIDKFSNLYIATSDYRIRKVSSAGIITTIAGTGIAGFAGDGAVAISALLGTPGGLATDDTGNVYIAQPDVTINRVRKIDMGGIIHTVAGNGSGVYSGDGMAATAAAISPYAISFDASNNLFIADSLNQRIYKVDVATQTLHRLAGNGTPGDIGDSGPATAAEVYTPLGLANDMCGNLYVATFGGSAPGTGRRIREILLKSSHPPVSATITASPGDTVCAGMAITVTASTTGMGTPYLYAWEVNGFVVASSTANSYSFTPVNGDIVKCIYKYIEQCSGDTIEVASNSLPLVVLPVSVPTISITATSPVIFGHTVTVNATVAGAGSGYYINWYNRNILFAITSTPMITYVKLSGEDTITAMVVSTSLTGCYDSATSAAAIVTGTPIWVKDVSTEDLSLTVFPNPAHNYLNISFSSSVTGGAVITVGNMHGSMLIRKIMKTASEDIDLTDLPSGVYTLSVTDSRGRRFMSKVVKE